MTSRTKPDAPATRGLMTADEMRETLVRLAEEIVAAPWADTSLVVVGIQRRGAVLGDRIHRLLEKRLSRDIDSGFLDITLYRDDLSSLGPHPVVNRTHIPFDLTRRTVVLVDDVIYTGRTVRAALDVLFSMGRPSRVVLVPLIDRGLRELPIQPDLLGIKVDTRPDQIVHVRVAEMDSGDEGVEIAESTGGSRA